MVFSIKILNLHTSYFNPSCLQKYTNVSTRVFLEYYHKTRNNPNISRETVTESTPMLINAWNTMKCMIFLRSRYTYTVIKKSIINCSAEKARYRKIYSVIFHLYNYKRERESGYVRVCLCVCVLRGIKRKDGVMFTIFSPLYLHHKEERWSWLTYLLSWLQDSTLFCRI